MQILCAYTDQKLAQQGQKNSTSVFTALTTFRISGLHWLQCSKIAIERNDITHIEKSEPRIFFCLLNILDST